MQTWSKNKNLKFEWPRLRKCVCDKMYSATLITYTISGDEGAVMAGITGGPGGPWSCAGDSEALKARRGGAAAYCGR